MQDNQIIFIVGPTAIGKTTVAINLARELNSEVISCDAMQVYRELPVTTNHPPPVSLHGIKHHLIGTRTVREEYDVASYFRDASSCLEDILGRKKYSIVCGGSGMYMQVLLDGIFEDGGRDEVLRNCLLRKSEINGPGKLHAELVKVDAPAAQKIHPNDTRRIVRALEVYYLTDQPISQQQKARSGWWEQYPIKIFALNRERSLLYSMIDGRVDEMLDQGMVKEITALKNVAVSRTARQIIGVEEVLGYIQGQIDLESCRQLIKQNTRRLAKRQLTWLRREKRLRWIEISGHESTRHVAGQIIEKLKEG